MLSQRDTESVTQTPRNCMARLTLIQHLSKTKYLTNNNAVLITAIANGTTVLPSNRFKRTIILRGRALLNPTSNTQTSASMSYDLVDLIIVSNNLESKARASLTQKSLDLHTFEFSRYLTS